MIRFEDLERIHVELSSACNAACPSCPRNVDGGYTVPWLEQRTMTLEDFQTVFDREVLGQIKDILMCGNYGDPIYCKALPEILEYIASVNDTINIRVHTNGGIRSPQWWASLPEKYQNLSVVFSIDGLADTNHIYRRKVDWTRLIQNVQAYIDAGGYAIWEYLIFAHNEHQIDDARVLSEELGFNEILFKRPFGFDSINKSYEAMRVVDEQGAVEYYIHPSTDRQYQNINQENETGSRYGKDRGLPRKAFERAWRTKNDNYDELIRREAENYSHLDGTEISCMTKNNREVYIDSAGNLHPCCFLGIGSQNATLAYDSLQYNRWLEKVGDENNLKKHSLREVMDRQFLADIEDTWKLTHRNGRMLCCSKMCSVKHDPKKGLYV